ncbi:MAG: chalcone isomerase family protein [Usitatibacteraceae bacterium]
MLTKIVLVICVAADTAASTKVKVGPAEVPNSWLLGTTTLMLNGAGIREYGVFRIAVYAAALYLPARETRAGIILQSISPRVVHMRMLRDVSQEDSARGWDHYLSANCVMPCQLAPNLRRQFLAIVPATATGDTQTFVFRDGSVEIFRNGARMGAVDDRTMATTVLAGWIGAVPTTEALKRALLGLTEPAGTELSR